MSKIFSLLISLTLILSLTGTALAQQPVFPADSDPNWQAKYWNNTSLSGAPVLERQETSLDHDWGSGSPAASVNVDGFSARWTRYIYVENGTFRFTTTSDDGIRVWVDNDLIINEWYDHPAKTTSAEKYLTHGHHWVVVEFYENSGLAVAKMTWAPTQSTVQNWRGEYFDNLSLSGTPALVRDDAQINFDWGSGSPALGVIGTDKFSVRWSRTLNMPAGNYRFAMTVDDGGRLWVNGHLLIDTWQEQSARTYTGEIFLPGGDVPLKMEYYENGGNAVARLSWSEVGTQPPASRTVVVDDGDPGFVRGGTPDSWRTVYEGYDGRLIWTWNNDWERPNYNWVTWYPDLAPGRYQVYVYIPERYTTTANARYWVSHANGNALRQVNQSTQGDHWVSLGTYWFDGTDDEYVFLSDATYETRLSRMVAFDAVKWVPR